MQYKWWYLNFNTKYSDVIAFHSCYSVAYKLQIAFLCQWHKIEI